MKSKTKATRKPARSAKPAAKKSAPKLDIRTLVIGKRYPEHGGVYSGIVKGLGKQTDRAIFRPTGKSADAIKGAWGPESNLEAAQDRLNGLENTRAMAKAGSEIARAALRLKVGRFADYYIASSREARIVATNEEGIYDDWRWTSTQHRDSTDDALVQTFGLGCQYFLLKSLSRAVVLVRSVPIR